MTKQVAAAVEALRALTRKELSTYPAGTTYEDSCENLVTDGHLNGLEQGLHDLVGALVKAELEGVE